MLRIILGLSIILSSCTPAVSLKAEKALFGSADRMEMYLLHSKAVSVGRICGMKSKDTVGSGVIVGHVGSKTLIATAEHVATAIKKSKCDITVYDWKGISGYAEIVKTDLASDISILAVDERLGEVAAMYPKPYLGQPITCVGWPVLPGMEFSGKSITRGYVSTLGVGKLIRVSADLYMGNSGGACFSEDGRIVGIVSQFAVGFQSFMGPIVPFPGHYYISHVDNLKKLLD